MEGLSLAGLFSLRSLMICLSLLSLYGLGLVVYRLYLHPLRKFPGPKIAAATHWYECYYDLIKGGQYTFKLVEMHERCGPIIRISPCELHVNDPDWIPVLYTGGSQKRDKYEWMSRQFGNPKSVFGTNPHDHHRLRRAALNPFFSAASIRKFEPIIKSKISIITSTLDRHYTGTSKASPSNTSKASPHGSTKPAPLGAAFSCLTTDVATQYAFGKSPEYLNNVEFVPNLHLAIASGSAFGHLAKHFNGVYRAVRSIPQSITVKLDPEAARFFDMEESLSRDIRELKDNLKTDEYDDSNIFSALLTGDLPADEKSVERLWHEAQVVIGAGTETTARTLEVIFFHLLDKPETMTQLCSELERAIPDPGDIPSWNQLEQLPYLTSVIHEGLRLGYGVVTRLQRLAHSPLTYRPSTGKGPEYTIPPMTPVGMSAYLIHHHEEAFPDSWTWKPERWLIGGKFNAGLVRYLFSFAKGSRQCAGINLAYAELYLATATVARRYGRRMQMVDPETTYSDSIEMVKDDLIVGTRNYKGLRVMISGD